MSFRRIPVALSIVTLILCVLCIRHDTTLGQPTTKLQQVQIFQKDPEMIDHFLPDTLAGWTGLIASVLGGGWAVLTFHRNNRIKAAEILMNLEREYANHINTLLKIENTPDYEEIYPRWLQVALYRAPRPAQKNELETYDSVINELESVLRHFYMCQAIRGLGVDSGIIDRMYSWYLRVLVTDIDVKTGKPLRPDLHEYIRHYWPSVYFWAYLAPLPFPKRFVARVGQINERLISWWTGSWAKPPVNRFKED